VHPDGRQPATRPGAGRPARRPGGRPREPTSELRYRPLKTAPTAAPHCKRRIAAPSAAVKITRDSFSIQTDELAVALLDAFGYGRKTADAIAAATQRIEWAVTQGYLHLDGTTITAAR
jgi:hypothetical protein